MSKRNPQLLLEDILLAIGKIERYTTDFTKETFLADEKTIDAVVRNLEIIGEAVRQLPDNFKMAHSDIPWWQVAGLRNRIVHDYFGLDQEIIWQIIEKDILDLRSKIRSLTTSS